MSFTFRPASSFTERHGVFVAVTGGTNSGKSYSALRLAKGLAGDKKIAGADTEGGRLLHLRKHFDFDAVMMEPPHRPEKYADVAKAAEDAGYGALVIDSFTMEWVGLGGVLDWQAEEYQRMGARDAVKLASWIKPKMAHKSMVYSLLQRRIPIVFSIRAEEKAKKVGSDVKAEWAPICNKAFPFEVTVSFMLMQDRQGIIDLRQNHKMEGSHRAIFRDGEQLSEQHGEQLAAWALGASPGSTSTAPATVEWPRFKKAGEFVAWSKSFLASATPEMAAGWEAQFRAGINRLKDRPEAGGDVIALMEAYDKAIQNGGDPGDFADDESAADQAPVDPQSEQEAA